MSDYPKCVPGSSVSELAQLAFIETVEEKYNQKFGIPPENVSHWNQAPSFCSGAGHLLPRIQPSPAGIIPYLYTYDIPEADIILERLGFDARKHGCILTPNGTTATLCVANWLRNRGKPVTIIGPFYFPILHQCKQLGVASRVVHLDRFESSFEIPIELQLDGAAVYLSNPVYCTGAPVSADMLARLQRHLEEGGIVIADECLARPGFEISRVLSRFPNFIGVYTPHKSVGINCVKFGAICFPRGELDEFEQWGDVFYGALQVSSSTAVGHFLSVDYERYNHLYSSEIETAWNEVRVILQGHSKVEFDRNGHGLFRTLYLPWLSSNLTSDSEMLWHIVEASGASFIPGNRNHFSPKIGFNFRINLARNSPQFRGALARLLRIFSAI